MSPGIQMRRTVVLIDNPMLLAREAWGPYVNDLRERCARDDSRPRLSMIGRTSQAYKLSKEMAELPFIALPREDRTHFLLNRLTHELCRMLYERGTLHADEAAHLPARSVGVFLSHAKRDGLAIAERIRDYIGRNLSLRSFFDARDILPGTRWKEVLETQASSCAGHSDRRVWLARVVSVRGAPGQAGGDSHRRDQRSRMRGGP